MRVQTVSGRTWKVEAVSERGETFWSVVVAETPEQALKSFRDQFPGHNVQEVISLLAKHVIVPT